ncbi:MAG: hypothetical protein P9M06_06290 [Candidatus Saelkia tenebricola]|nr:hypothetical protein [Candidatus Saelkia tenebricola]
MKKLLLLFVSFNLFSVLSGFEHYLTRRIRDNIPHQAIYFYQDELGIVGDWLSDADISEDEQAQLLRIATNLGIFRQEVESSLSDIVETRIFIQKIAKRALISLAEIIQDGNKRYLNVVNRIPEIVLGILGNLHQEEVLSESDLILAQDNLGDTLLGVLMSNDDAITAGERMIALKGLEEYGQAMHLRDLIKLQDSMPVGIDSLDLNATIGVLAAKFLPEFKSFFELENIVKNAELTPVVLRLKDGSFVEVESVKTHVRFFAVFWWEHGAEIELSDGSIWSVSWDEFLDKISNPLIWNNFL